MAAIDTFEWFVSGTRAESSPEFEQYVRLQREYLFTLRSEDERQRFVDEVVHELRQRGVPRGKHS